jgi:hypothetical protein
VIVLNQIKDFYLEKTNKYWKLEIIKFSIKYNEKHKSA